MQVQSHLFQTSPLLLTSIISQQESKLIQTPYSHLLYGENEKNDKIDER